MHDLKKFIHDLNKSWMEGRYDDLHEYYHKDVVLLPPGMDQPVKGAEAMVESYRQFGAMGTVHKIDILDIQVFSFHSAAVCHVKFDVDYEIEAGRFQEQGMEVYTIDTSGDSPKIIWRTQVTLKTYEG
jgi:ketosteroid isomerase-like protein